MLQKLLRHWVPMGLGVLVVAFFLAHAGGKVSASFIDRLEFFAYDARLQFNMPGGVEDSIVIIDIDEKSLQAEGRWPWGRDKVARLVETVFEDHQAGLLGFDIVFAEPDESSGLQMLESLAEDRLGDVEEFRRVVDELRPELDHDGQLAAALARYPVVLGYYFSQGQGLNTVTSGALPEPVFDDKAFEGRKIPLPEASGYGANLPEFQRAALGGGGHFNPHVDTDGVVRKVPMLYKYEDKYYASLSLTMARRALQNPDLTPGFPPGSSATGVYQPMEWLQLGDRRIPVDEGGHALVPYRGTQGSFPYVSATDLLNGRVPKGSMQGRIALVGTSAPGLNDLRATPVQENYSGVEVHANLLFGMLARTILDNPAYTIGAEFLLLVAAGLSLVIVLPLVSPAVATGIAFIALACYTGINLWFWNSQNLVFALAPGLLMILGVYVLNMTYGFFIESRGKRQLAGLFGQYIPPELVDEMSVDPTHYSMEAQSRNLTVLFTDVRGFTTISEGLDPKELAELMREFLTPMTAVIHRHRGTIDKYMGDAVMCFWGAPVDDPDHAVHALEAALEMLDVVHRLGPEFEARGWPPVKIGVGLNTGMMSVGDMGSQFRRAYTVLGDAVNLGSRLEGQTKSYGVELIVSETTREAAPGFVYRELDRIRVKGKDEPVTIYEPVGRKENVGDEVVAEIKRYRQALRQYRAQEWDQAEIQFVNLANEYPDRELYQVYIERIKINRANPPGKNWDGVFTATSK